MRVGANARQFARIKRMHKEGTPAHAIAKSIQMTDQSLEKILARLDGREEKNLAIEDNVDVQEMRIANAELAARLAKYEDPQSGETIQHGDDEISTEEVTDDEAQVQAAETVEKSPEVETQVVP
jgi:hypothetical protein